MTTQTRHPGAGRAHARSTPKGRQIDPVVSGQIRALLGDMPRERGMLIECLHRIQDSLGRIPPAHLAALADEMRLSMAEVYEVATFYAHFEVSEAPAAALTIRVCDGLPCAMRGAEALAEAVAAGVVARVVRVPCVGRCDTAPVAQVGQNFIDGATLEGVRAAAVAGAVLPVLPDWVGYAAYVAAGGYATLGRVRRGELAVEAVLGTLDAARLSGMGGAGFPTGRKWRAVRDQAGPRLMAVNADEGEPGTFKDRLYLERDPHRVLEGVLIAAHVVGAEAVWIYVRDEYPAGRAILARAIAELPEGGPVLHLRRGAGAYVCGEESAMLESIEGKRGLPRHKPPYVFQHGLWGRPTLVNNVETLWWIREVLERGAEWWTSHGRHGRRGLRSFSVSGRVRLPGVKLAPAGITLRELVEEYCGGMEAGHRLAAYLPGGASGGILPERLADLPLDFGTLEAQGCFIGSAAVIVLSEADDLRAVALNLMRFFRHESCGQCTPCRAGTEKAVAEMERGRWDWALLQELSATMRDASICGLGQAAPNPLLSLVRHFPGEAGL